VRIPIITIPVDSFNSYVELSTDGQRILVATDWSEEDEYLSTVYDIEDNNLIEVYAVESQVVQATMSADGRFLAIVSDREIHETSIMHEVSIIDIENDEILAQESFTSSTEVRTIDSETGREVVYQNRMAVTPQSLNLSNTSLLVEFSSDDPINYNWESGELVIEALSEQNLRLATDSMNFYKDDERVLRITATDGMTLHEIDMERDFYPIVISDDGQRLWIGFTDGTVELWGIQR